MNVSPDYPYPVPFPTSGTPPLGGQVLTGSAVRSAYNDSSPSVWDDWIGGGFRSVDSTVERDAIQDSWRKEGMLVLCCDTGIVYKLTSDLVTWTVLTVIPANGSITKAMLESVATATIRGRVSAGTGVPEDLTASEVKTLLAIAAGDVSGLGSLATQSGTFSGTSSGTNTGDQPTPTGSGVSTVTAGVQDAAARPIGVASSTDILSRADGDARFADLRTKRRVISLILNS